jgi:hypothetical protein
VNPILIRFALPVAAVGNVRRSSPPMHGFPRFLTNVIQRVAVPHRNHRKNTPTNPVAAKISYLPAVTSLALIASPSANAIKDRFSQLMMHLRVSSSTCRTSELPKSRWQTMRPTPSFRARRIRSQARSFGLYLPRFDSSWARILLLTTERFSSW